MKLRLLPQELTDLPKRAAVANGIAKVAEWVTPERLAELAETGSTLDDLISPEFQHLLKYLVEHHQDARVRQGIRPIADFLKKMSYKEFLHEMARMAPDHLVAIAPYPDWTRQFVSSIQDIWGSDPGPH